MPADPEPTYLDHNATSPLKPEVRDAMLPFLGGVTGNATSLHAAGRRSKQAVETARAHVAALVGATDPAEIVFTSGGTEADVLALRGTFERDDLDPSFDTLVTTAVEHPAVLQTARLLQSHGVRVLFTPVDAHGRLADPVIDDRTRLVSVMAANNETGNLYDIAGIARRARETGALVHTDAVQALGRIAIDAAGWGLDLLSASAHKLGGPTGVGCLYLAKGVSLAPVSTGGGQERGLRSGTLNVAGIVGFGEAARLAKERLSADAARVRTLRDRFEAGVIHAVPGVVFQGDLAHRLPNTSSLSIPGTKGEALLMAMDAMGFCVSTGSACSSGSGKPSHVLVAMGVPAELLGASLRVSLAASNTEAEVDAAVAALADVARHLRHLATGS